VNVKHPALGQTAYIRGTLDGRDESGLYMICAQEIAYGPRSEPGQASGSPISSPAKRVRTGNNALSRAVVVDVPSDDENAAAETNEAGPSTPSKAAKGKGKGRGNQ
jgi:hypothetical protein